MFLGVIIIENNLEIASRYLFINMVIKNLELDLQHIKNGQFKIKDPYLELIEKIIFKAINQRRELKRLMHQRKIQVVLLYRQGDYSTYKFIFGHQELNKTFMKQVIKKNVENIIRKLLESS